MKTMMMTAVFILKHFTRPSLVAQTVKKPPPPPIKVEKNNKGIKDIRFVLVFDDFERCSIPVKELLGLINLYLETYDIKTIILGAEDKTDTREYKEFKEKVVSKTIKFHQSENEIASRLTIIYDRIEKDDYHKINS